MSDPLPPAHTPPPASGPVPPEPPAPVVVNRPAEESGKESGSIKDTLESVIIALILAFVFRAFVVEAFVIPTGSMATTLLGAHLRYRCQDCGHDFKANYNGSFAAQRSDEMSIPATAHPRVFNLVCPNCGYKVPRTIPDDPDNDASSPPVHYGDRILVLKYAYLFNDPSRWDVVVFKSPTDQSGAVDKPEFQQNFIKRLVGLPGEQLMVLDGDVYVRRSDAEAWTVQTKPRHVQEVLWRVVHDNDEQPRGLPRSAPVPAYRPPWSAAGFTASRDGRAFTSPETGTAALTFDPSADPSKHAFTDFLSFNMTAQQQFLMDGGGTLDQYDSNLSETFNRASDLQLRVTLARGKGDGPVRLVLGKLGHTFRAELLPGAASLVHVAPDGRQTVLGTAPLPATFAGGTPTRVEFENVDYRVALRVDGKELLSSTPAQYAPDVFALLEAHHTLATLPAPTAGVETASAAATVSHLSLWRDIYYTNSTPARVQQMLHGVPARSGGREGGPVVLGPKEFFVLGDNSQLSLDSRFWSQPVDLRRWEDLYAESGIVPERFLLGKAFFVYWPAGYRPFGWRLGLIPNFGDMRVIH